MIVFRSTHFYANIYKTAVDSTRHNGIEMAKVVRRLSPSSAYPPAVMLTETVSVRPILSKQLST